MTKWNKEQDRALSARAGKTTLFWDSARNGLYIKPETILARALARAAERENDTRFVVLHSEGIL